jgi:hypothetical protein
MDSHGKANRRCLQFSLRTVLVLVTVFSVFMSWFSVRLRCARRQGQAVATVRARYMGQVYYESQLEMTNDPLKWTGKAVPPWCDGANWVEARSSAPKWLVDLLGPDFFCEVAAVSESETGNCERSWLTDLPHLKYLALDGRGLTDLDLEYIAGLRELRLLDLNSDEAGIPNVTGAGFSHVEHLKRLRGLYIGGSTIDDAGMQYLSGLDDLEELDLYSTRIGDAGLARIQRLRKLRFLGVSGTRITDGAMATVNMLTNLVTLDISDTNIGDAGIARLGSLPHLRAIYVGRTHVTEEGIKRLAELPELQTIWDNNRVPRAVRHDGAPGAGIRK